MTSSDPPLDVPSSVCCLPSNTAALPALSTTYAPTHFPTSSPSTLSTGSKAAIVVAVPVGVTVTVLVGIVMYRYRKGKSRAGNYTAELAHDLEETAAATLKKSKVNEAELEKDDDA